MKAIKISFKKSKTTKGLLFFLYLLYLVLNLSFLILMHNTTTAYLAKLSAYTEDIESLTSTTEQAAQRVLAEKLVTELSSSTQDTLLFMFVLAPLVVLILWIIFQGIIWYIINKQHISNAVLYWKQCIIATIIAAAIAVVLITNMPLTSLSHFFIALFLTFIIYYLLTVSYLVAGRKQHHFITTVLSHALPNLRSLAFSVIALFLTSMIIVFLTLSVYIYATTSVSIFPLPFLSLFLLVAIAANLALRFSSARKFTWNEK